MSNKSAFLVFAQFLCILFFLIDRPIFAHNYLIGIQIVSFIWALWGVFVMKFGRFNIQPEVKNNAELIIKGPYKLVRNPMYGGIIFFFLISLINYFNFYRIAVLMVLIIVLVLKIKLEEYYLAQKFGTSYSKYKSVTKRLIPFLF